jgi:hypothetical protein
MLAERAAIQGKEWSLDQSAPTLRDTKQALKDGMDNRVEGAHSYCSASASKKDASLLPIFLSLLPLPASFARFYSPSPSKSEQYYLCV